MCVGLPGKAAGVHTVLRIERRERRGGRARRWYILFVMWNIPYFSPYGIRFGECNWQGWSARHGLLTTLPGENALLRASIQRFIFFDAAGLLVLTLACWLTIRLIPRP